MSAQVDFFDQVCEIWDEISRPDDHKIAFLLDQIGLQPGDKVLDVGTGTGVLIPFIGRRTGDSPIHAVDVSPGMIRVAGSKFGNLGHVTFFEQDVERHTLTERYDKIILYSVYPHLDRKVETIRSLMGLLEPGGRLMIAHAQSRAFLNDMHKRKDPRVSRAALIPVNLQKAEFEAARLHVSDARENDEFYYLVLSNVYEPVAAGV